MALESSQPLSESQMNSHKHARLTRSGRVHMVGQIARIGLKAAAEKAGSHARCGCNLSDLKLEELQQ